MRRLFILFFFLPLLTKAQILDTFKVNTNYPIVKIENTAKGEVLDGVWGLKFGESVQNVKQIVKAKTGKIPEVIEPELLSIKNVAFGGRDAYLVKLLFYKDRLFGCDAIFLPDREPQILSLFNAIKSDIISKWFPPQIDLESYKYPYEKGDGHELTAIKMGYSTIGTIWYFPKSAKENISGNILMTIEPEVYTKISYRDGTVSKQFHKEVVNKANDDF